MASTPKRYIHDAEPVYQLQPPAPNVGRNAIDVGGNYIRFHFVLGCLCRRVAAIDRIDKAEERLGLITVAQRGKCPDGPERGVRILPTVFTNPGRYPFT